MGEPWVVTKNNIVSGSGFLRLLPTTAVDMKITAIGANVIDFLQVTEETTKVPDLSPKQEKITKELSTGITIVAPKAKKFVNAIDGYLTGEDVEYSFEMKVLMSISAYKGIVANQSSPFFAVKGRGYDVLGNHLGYQFLLGYIGNFDYTTKSDFVEVSLVIKGGLAHTLGTGVTLTSINTKLQGQIEAVGKAPVTIPALTESDLGVLLSGAIVNKDET